MDEQAKRILLVDDEPDVLEICSRALTRAGYEVRAAAGASQARLSRTGAV